MSCNRVRWEIAQQETSKVELVLQVCRTVKEDMKLASRSKSKQLASWEANGSPSVSITLANQTGMIRGLQPEPSMMVRSARPTLSLSISRTDLIPNPIWWEQSRWSAKLKKFQWFLDKASSMMLLKISLWQVKIRGRAGKWWRNRLNQLWTKTSLSGTVSPKKTIPLRRMPRLSWSPKWCLWNESMCCRKWIRWDLTILSWT